MQNGGVVKERFSLPQSASQPAPSSEGAFFVGMGLAPSAGLLQFMAYQPPHPPQAVPLPLKGKADRLGAVGLDFPQEEGADRFGAIGLDFSQGEGIKRDSVLPHINRLLGNVYPVGDDAHIVPKKNTKLAVKNFRFLQPIGILNNKLFQAFFIKIEDG